MNYFIDQYLQRIRNEQPERRNEIHVFDMGCGKGRRYSYGFFRYSLLFFSGGDQLKWGIGRVKFVTFSGQFENKLHQCLCV